MAEAYLVLEPDPWKGRGNRDILIAIIIIIVLFFLFSILFSYFFSEPAPAPVPTGNAVVYIEGSTLKPQDITLRSGDTLTFVNNDKIERTVSSPALAIESNIPAGGTFSTKLYKKGTFDYTVKPNNVNGNIEVI